MQSNTLPSAYDNAQWAGATDKELVEHMLSERVRLQNDESLLPRVLDSKGPVLDWGSGPISVASGMTGSDAYAYDPSPAMRASVSRFLASDRIFDSVDAIPDETFERIWCSLVLCIVDDPAVADTLRSVRQKITASGRVLFTICNPALFNTPRTRLDLRFPEGLAADTNCILPKWKLECAPDDDGQKKGYGVYERHRPVGWYAEQMKQEGFDIQMKLTTPQYELDGQQILGDYLCFQCTPSA